MEGSLGVTLGRGTLTGDSGVVKPEEIPIAHLGSQAQSSGIPREAPNLGSDRGHQEADSSSHQTGFPVSYAACPACWAALLGGAVDRVSAQGRVEAMAFQNPSQLLDSQLQAGARQEGAGSGSEGGWQG